MVNWHLGTVGFSYKDWDGVFYPKGTPARNYLAHYSQVFRAVELDSTFYGTPPPDRVRKWAAAVPADFKFCVKTPRQISHELRLANAVEPMLRYLDTMALLGPKLGAILVQLPPNFTATETETVAAFLAKLPAGHNYALEFRHRSWFRADTAALLKAYNVCWVSTEYLNMPKQIDLTADFLYIRWLGKHGQFKQKDREQIDPTLPLSWWWKEIQAYLNNVQTVYGFFNNDYAGHSPSTCNRFKSMVGLPTTYPQLPQQGRLF